MQKLNLLIFFINCKRLPFAPMVAYIQASGNPLLLSKDALKRLVMKRIFAQIDSGFPVFFTLQQFSLPAQSLYY